MYLVALSFSSSPVPDLAGLLALPPHHFGPQFLHQENGDGDVNVIECPAEEGLGGHTVGPVLLPASPCQRTEVPRVAEWEAVEAAVARMSVPRGAQEAQRWQPAPFPQRCGGILPASHACGRVSGLWLSQFLPAAEGPSVSQCLITRYPQLPLDQPGLTGLVTGSQRPPRPPRVRG